MANELTLSENDLKLSAVFVDSGFFKDAKSEPQAIVKMLLGRELGLSPMASMMGIHIINGKPEVGAHLQAAIVRSSGRYDYEVVEHDDAKCSIQFFDLRHGARAKLGPPSTFTIDDAKRAGLLANGTWKAYPRNMLFARALTNGLAWHCPDLMGGCRVYGEGELSERETSGSIQARVLEECVEEARVIEARIVAKAGDPVTLQARVDGPAPTPNTKATAAPASPPAPTPTNPKASAVGAAVATSKAPGVAAPLATTMRDVRCVPFSPPVREILESWGYASDGWSEIKGLLDGEDFVEIHKAAAERLETDEGLGLVWAAVGTPARTYPTIRQAEQFVGLVEARAKAALAPRVVPAPGLAARMGVPAGHDLAPDESVDTETGEVVSSDRPLDATPTPAVGTPIPSSVEGMRSTQLAPARSCLADEVTAKDPSKAEARPVKSWAPVATVEDVLARIGRSQGSHAEAVIAAPEGELVSQALQGACTNLLHAAVEAEHGPANASAKSTMTKALKACRLSLAERWTGGALRLLIGRFAVRFPDALGKGVQSWA